DVGIQMPNSVQQRDAGHFGHPLVGHDDVDRLRLEEQQRLLDTGGAEYLVIPAQQALETVDYVRFIIDDQEGVAHHVWELPIKAGCTNRGVAAGRWWPRFRNRRDGTSAWTASKLYSSPLAALSLIPLKWVLGS